MSVFIKTCLGQFQLLNDIRVIFDIKSKPKTMFTADLLKELYKNFIISFIVSLFIFSFSFIFKIIDPNYFICNKLKTYKISFLNRIIEIYYPISCDQEPYYSAIKNLNNLFSSLIVCRTCVEFNH